MNITAPMHNSLVTLHAFWATEYICLYFVFFILPVMFNYRLQCWSLLTIKHFDAFLEEKYYHVFIDSDY